MNEHNHASSNPKIEITKVRAGMRRKVETTIDPPQRILSDRLAGASAEAAKNLHRIDNIHRTIRRYRHNIKHPLKIL